VLGILDAKVDLVGLDSGVEVLNEALFNAGWPGEAQK
jgi:hypothetical protein